MSKKKKEGSKKNLESSKEISSSSGVTVGKLEELMKQWQECSDKELFTDAISLSREIIILSKKKGNKKTVQEHEKKLKNIIKKAKEKYKDKDLQDYILDLHKVKKEYSESAAYEEAIKTSRRIIAFLLLLNEESEIPKEETFIKSMQEERDNKPTKIEIVDQVEKLKGIRQTYAIQSKNMKAIEISKRIIKFAKMASLEEVIKDEEKFIDSIQRILDEGEFIVNGINEFKQIKELEYDILIKHNAIKEAHVLMEGLRKKYQEYPKIISHPEINEIITEEHKFWIKFNVAKGEKKEEGEEKEVEQINGTSRKNIVRLELQIVRLQEEKSRLRRELSKIKRREELSETGQTKAILEKEIDIIEKEKKRMEIDRKKLKKQKEELKAGREKEKKEVELNKLRLEEEQMRIKIEKLKLQREKENEKKIEDSEKIILMLEKTEIEEQRERLSVEITRFMEEKQQYQQKLNELEEKLELEQQLLENALIFEDERQKLDEEKEKLEWEKIKLEEIKVDMQKFEEDKKKFEEEREKLNKIKKKLMEL